MPGTYPDRYTRPWTEVEGAVFDTAHEAHLADMAYDPDAGLWEQYRDLLALEGLAPLTHREPEPSP